MTFLEVLWVCLVGEASARILLNSRALHRRRTNRSRLFVDLAFWICLGGVGLAKLVEAANPLSLIATVAAVAVFLWEAIASERGTDSSRDGVAN